MLKKFYAHKDRLILGILAAHLPLLFVVGLVMHHSEHVLPGVFVLLLAVIVCKLKPGTLFSRGTLAVGLIIYSAILIHVTNGMIEMHFHIFAVLALLSIYYDWKVIAIAACTTVLHHLGWFILPLYSVFNNSADLIIYFIHVFFVVLTSSTLCYQSYILRRSVNSINASSQVLVQHDLPQLLEYLQHIATGDLGDNSLQFKAQTVPIVANDEFGDLSRLYNQIIQVCEAISSTTSLMSQGLNTMIQHSHETTIHIRNLCERVSRTTGNQFSVPEIGLARVTKLGNFGVSAQIEMVNANMVLAALRLDAMQYFLETKVTQQTELNAQLEKMSQIKNRFFASLSHELRTPLTAILGYSELLEVDPNNNLDVMQKAGVRQINDSAIGMRNLINDILDSFKIEAGKLTIFLTKVDLSKAIAKALNEVQVLADSKKQTLVQKCEANMQIQADVARLHQILLNLLSNAIKFTPREGQIEVRVQTFHFTQERVWQTESGEAWNLEGAYPALNLATGEWVGIQVADNGRGIAANQLPLVFEEFQQIETETQSSIGGTGLGLTIVKNLTSLMGGQVIVESQAGRGTTFTVLLQPFRTETQMQSTIDDTMIVHLL